ncbi:MAG: hypothetical protein Q9166_005839 [cf. Caloplaca sp. 2 TL-2023]
MEQIDVIDWSVQWAMPSGSVTNYGTFEYFKHQAHKTSQLYDLSRSMVQVGGSRPATTYGAIFASDDISIAPTFKKKSGNSLLPGIAAADKARQDLMTDNAVQSAQLTIYKIDVAKHQSAYQYTAGPSATENNIESNIHSLVK